MFYFWAQIDAIFPILEKREDNSALITLKESKSFQNNS